ncbi:MAG TPA: transaldolase family protein [Xanthobacteraceae bacterium]|jgi:transaldolase
MSTKLGGNRLYDLQRFGQSAWLECVQPRLLAGSRFAHLVKDGISGVDINLARFAAAYADDLAYGKTVEKLRSTGATAQQIYEHLSLEDLRHAADRLRPVYRNAGRRDGYVSVDLSPALADDADATESEARRLWSLINRPNAMIKVPATDAGLVAIRRLIAAGINVNATSIFGTRRHRQVADAYVMGLEDRVDARLPLEGIVSVASISVRRIDTAVDRELDAIQRPEKATRINGLRGKAAIAVAQYAYQRYKIMLASPRWQPLAAAHAQPQRLLWTSADTGQACESDLKYVNRLIGRDTITSMSLDTADAYRDHGAAAPTLERNLLEVLALLGDIETVGIDLDRVGAQLQRKNIGETAAGVNTALTRLASAA